MTKEKTLKLANGSVIKFVSSGGNATLKPAGLNTSCYWRDETLDEYMEEEYKKKWAECNPNNWLSKRQ